MYSGSLEVGDPYHRQWPGQWLRLWPCHLLAGDGMMGKSSNLPEHLCAVRMIVRMSHRDEGELNAHIFGLLVLRFKNLETVLLLKTGFLYLRNHLV